MQHQRTTLSKLRNRTFKALAFLAALYPLLRRPILTWGATSEEAASRLPGDQLLEDADGVSTRAITIDAPAASVWPWLAQMGPSPRGGAYTYDWIENLLGLDMHSVDRVLPEFQDPQVGDRLTAVPPETRGGGLRRVRPGLLRRDRREVRAERALRERHQSRARADPSRSLARRTRAARACLHIAYHPHADARGCAVTSDVAQFLGRR